MLHGTYNDILRLHMQTTMTCRTSRCQTKYTVTSDLLIVLGDFWETDVLKTN